MEPNRVKRLLATVTAAACLAGTATALAVPAQAASAPAVASANGAGNWKCKPSSAHPYPVVLVHGTTANSALNWASLSPKLARAGYCVFALDYGMTLTSAGVIGGLGDIPTSARTMAAFVDKVRAATGTTKVDVVGHSQGGMMPNYYIKRLGGADKVRTLVGLAPSNHGTTVNGLADLVTALGLLGWVKGYFDLIQAPAFVQQTAGSPFMKALFADGDTVPGVRYAVIQTSRDNVVTPYTNAFLHGGDVTSVLLQDQCPRDPVGHAGLALDSPTHQNVLNILGPDIPGFKATCTGYGPAF